MPHSSTSRAICEPALRLGCPGSVVRERVVFVVSGSSRLRRGPASSHSALEFAKVGCRAFLPPLQPARSGSEGLAVGTGSGAARLCKTNACVPRCRGDRSPSWRALETSQERLRALDKQIVDLRGAKIIKKNGGRPLRKLDLCLAAPRVKGRKSLGAYLKGSGKPVYNSLAPLLCDAAVDEPNRQDCTPARRGTQTRRHG